MFPSLRFYHHICERASHSVWDLQNKQGSQHYCFGLFGCALLKYGIVKFFSNITLFSDVENDDLSTSISSSTSWTSPGTSDSELKIWAELSRVRNSSSYHTNSKYITLHNMDIRPAFIKIISLVTSAKQ